jgi:hypothetical protein
MVPGDLRCRPAQALGLNCQGMAVDLCCRDGEIAEVRPGLRMVCVVFIEGGLHHDRLE